MAHRNVEDFPVSTDLAAAVCSIWRNRRFSLVASTPVSTELAAVPSGGHVSYLLSDAFLFCDWLKSKKSRVESWVKGVIRVG